MDIYLINGRSNMTGQWEVELFKDRKEAENVFEYYVKDYEIEDVDKTDLDLWIAKDEARDVEFWLEKRTL